MDVQRYAAEATARLVALDEPASGNWRKVVADGLTEAHSQGDAEALLSMVQLVAHLLDGAGRFEDAVGEIDHALALSRRSPDAQAILCGLKASMLAAPARMQEARAALRRGEAHLGETTRNGGLRFRVFRQVVSWQTLDGAAEDSEALLDECEAAGLERDRLYLVSWYIPYLAALGDRRRAHPWIRTFRIAAEASGNRWRVSDSAAFESWDEFFSGPEERHEPVGLISANALSVCRGEGVRLRESVLRRDRAAAETALHNLGRAHKRLGSANMGALSHFETATGALFDFAPPAHTLEPPAEVHLNNLGSVLAAGEAIAATGTQTEAMLWLATLDGVPERWRSAMEWPTSTGRVRGLLALRTGDLRRARRELQACGEWAATEGFRAEAALSKLQLGELGAAAELRVPERTWKADRKAGADSLRELGYDAVPAAHTVAHHLAAQGSGHAGTRLTPREVQVLGLLAEGLTYRAASARLGVAAPTVQTLAHRVYEKLGVSGKIPAIAEAKRLGIL